MLNPIPVTPLYLEPYLQMDFSYLAQYVFCLLVLCLWEVSVTGLCFQGFAFLWGHDFGWMFSVHRAGQIVGPVNLETHILKFWEISLKYLFDNVLLTVPLFLEYMLQLVAGVQIFLYPYWYVLFSFFMNCNEIGIKICNYDHGFIHFFP